MRKKLQEFFKKIVQREGWAYETVPSIVVLTLGLLTTVLLSAFAHHAVTQDRRARFDHYTRQVVNDIQTRIAAYTSALEDTRSLFLLHPGTSREQFRAYVQTMNLQTKYPGSLGISYVPIIAAERLKAHEAAVRKELPSYRVWPNGPRATYSSILYLEPRSEASARAIGYDMMSDPVRRAAMERARDTGEPAMSKKVSLANDQGSDGTPGFVLYVPIYRNGAHLKTTAQRRGALVGFVTSPFQSDDLFSHITGVVTTDGILGVEIYDGTSAERSKQTMLFDDDDMPGTPAKGALQSTVQLDVAGTPWTVDFVPGPRFDDGATSRAPWYVLFAGLVVTILLYRLWSNYDSYNLRLRESETRLTLVTDSLPALIALIGKDGRYQFANEAHMSWFGLSPKDVLGQPIESVIASGIEPAASDGFRRARLGERVDFEMSVNHRALGLRRVNVECIPRPDRPREGFVALATDVTEHMKLVEALKTSESNYRSTATENERLYKQSQQLNRAKDDFLATLSHELRTPLTVILGHAELLKECQGVPPDAGESVESILRNARIQNQLVSDLIDVSSIITGKITLQMNVVCIADMTRGAIASSRLAANAKGVELLSDLRDENAFIRGDMNRLQQITLNLLTNAIKFTPTGGRVSVTGRLSGGEYEIRVRDSGKGIEAEFLPHVFDRFRQEDNSMTRQHGGLGLGLSIVRNLVEAHHGTVEAKSDGREHGAEFIVRIPAFPALPAEKELVNDAHRPALRAGEGARRALENKRVLIVDDEPDARRLVARYLERAGATVFPTGSAKEAIAALEKFDAELIISDIGMPDEDGYSLLRRLRADERSHDRAPIPAIALTAFAREEDRQRAFAAGYDAHLSKPVGSGTLTETALETLLGKNA